MSLILLASTFNPSGLKGEQIFIQNAVQKVWFSLHPTLNFTYKLADPVSGGWFEFDLLTLDRPTRTTLWEALIAALGPHYLVMGHGDATGHLNMYIGFNYGDGSGKYQESGFRD